ncbi:DUF3306 domain-containing protein [Thioalbus denitrificans]|uniref:Uncharacterized protein DUF3306 n=1 Tax=Thioalbus denitrificans TaxID=547122 RepID=A0A369BXZ7_9GAMM|nr:DUF3306 domain-containing protein [Thioalbus denitrificans]RCX26580.1 uncharacterized protein DUF3306 [Thioalbus denitrificans]
MKDEPGTVTGPPAEGDFLDRWSRRKLAAARPSPEPAAPASPPGEPGAEGATAGGEAGLPPLESLDADSDYRGFLSPEVDEVLRRVALRRLFHLPAFNVTDGLDDYAEDFTQFAPLGDTVTHEMRRMLEREAERAAAAEHAGRAGVADGLPPEPAAGEAVPAPDPVSGTGPADTDHEEDETQDAV